MKSNALGHLYKDGEIIIKQNTTGNCLYVIQEGKVEVIDENDGNEIKIAGRVLARHRDVPTFPRR